MENTIMLGADIRVNKNTVIKHNSIVAFKTPNSNEMKVLRVLGCPGDEIEINNGEIYVNKTLFQKPASSKKIYTVFLRDKSLFKKLEKYKFSPYSPNYCMYSLACNEYEDILKMNIVDSIYISRVDSNQTQLGVIKSESSKYSNIYYFGPVKIPIANTIINSEILSIIPQYLSVDDIGSKIQEDYYFCIGDNFPEAKDSRFIGLIPKSSIIGVVDKIQKITSLSVNSQQ